MLDFSIEKIDDSPFYNVTLMKDTHKRSGEVVREAGEKIYGVPLHTAKLRITYNEVIANKGDISLKEFLQKFYKSYKEVCELLKKTL